MAIMLLAPMAAAMDCHGVTGPLMAHDTVLKPGVTFAIDLENDEILKSFEARGAIEGNREADGASPAAWWIELRGNEGKRIGRVTMGWENSRYGDIDDTRKLTVTITAPRQSSSITEEDCIVSRSEITQGVDMHSGYNTLAIKPLGNGLAGIWIGGEEYRTAGSINIPAGITSVIVGGNSTLRLASVNLKTARPPQHSPAILWTEEAIDNRLHQSDDPREGIYEFLDSDIDTDLCRAGGSYRLAALGNGHGGYDLIYLGGAVENSRMWEPGMLKGKLSPTVFLNHFNLEWIDASMCDEIDAGAWAELNGTILDLRFPSERGAMRFSRALTGR